MFLLKIRLKNTQNHDVARGLGGFLSVGVQTSILHPNEVQRVFSTPPKPFYVMLIIQFLGAEWHLVKSRFWPHFLTILYIKIVYFSVLYLICRFFLRSVGLYSTKIKSIWNICFSCMKIYFEEIFWSLFVTNYCIFELTVYDDCREKDIRIILSLYL